MVKLEYIFSNMYQHLQKGLDESPIGHIRKKSIKNYKAKYLGPPFALHRSQVELSFFELIFLLGKKTNFCCCCCCCCSDQRQRKSIDKREKLWRPRVQTSIYKKKKKHGKEHNVQLFKIVLIFFSKCDL